MSVLQRSQSGRLDDQRGTLIHDLEMPEFLKVTSCTTPKITRSKPISASADNSPLHNAYVGSYPASPMVVERHMNFSAIDEQFDYNRLNSSMNSGFYSVTNWKEVEGPDRDIIDRTFASEACFDTISDKNLLNDNSSCQLDLSKSHPSLSGAENSKQKICKENSAPPPATNTSDDVFHNGHRDTDIRTTPKFPVPGDTTNNMTNNTKVEKPVKSQNVPKLDTKSKPETLPKKPVHSKQPETSSKPISSPKPIPSPKPDIISIKRRTSSKSEILPKPKTSPKPDMKMKFTFDPKAPKPDIQSKSKPISKTELSSKPEIMRTPDTSVRPKSITNYSENEVLIGLEQDGYEIISTNETKKTSHNNKQPTPITSPNNVKSLPGISLNGTPYGCGANSKNRVDFHINGNSVFQANAVPTPEKGRLLKGETVLGRKNEKITFV